VTEESALLSKESHLLQALADESGYRLERFLALLHPAEEE
jgi:hypothetical protein